MLMTNKQIYTNAQALIKSFNNYSQELPIKMNFYIQKNKKILRDLAEEIELTRQAIVKECGIQDKNTGDYTVSDPASQKIAIQKINDLLSLEQDVNIFMLELHQIDENLSLTVEQMDAILFMIQE